MREPNNIHDKTTRVLSVAMCVVGIALIVRTFSSGGGFLSAGLLAGVLFIAAGAGRFWLTLRKR